MSEGGNGATTAIIAGVYATLALDIYSTLNSSPQTTELFAGDREESLMHWVLIGDAVAILGGVYGTFQSRKPAALVGALLIVVMMHLLYRHAVKRGLSKAPPAAADNGGGWG